jgi:hypothetical protein
VHVAQRQFGGRVERVAGGRRRPVARGRERRQSEQHVVHATVRDEPA